MVSMGVRQARPARLASYLSGSVSTAVVFAASACPTTIVVCVPALTDVVRNMQPFESHLLFAHDMIWHDVT